MEKEIETIKNLVIKNTIRDIQIKILKQKKEGMIINENIINEILFDVEAGLNEKTDIEAKKEELIENAVNDEIENQNYKHGEEREVIEE